MTDLRTIDRAIRGREYCWQVVSAAPLDEAAARQLQSDQGLPPEAYGFTEFQSMLRASDNRYMTTWRSKYRLPGAPMAARAPKVEPGQQALSVVAPAAPVPGEPAMPLAQRKRGTDRWRVLLRFDGGAEETVIVASTSACGAHTAAIKLVGQSRNPFPIRIEWLDGQHGN